LYRIHVVVAIATATDAMTTDSWAPDACDGCSHWCYELDRFHRQQKLHIIWTLM